MKMRNTNWKRYQHSDQVWLSRNKKRPDKKRINEMKDLLWDNQTVRVYCDCSISQDGKVAGLASSFVGLGSTIVKSNKHYSLAPMTNLENELRAIIFSLKELSSYFSKKEDELQLPNKVLIYSDLAQITDGLSGRIWAKKPKLKILIDEILEKQNELSVGIMIDILYLESSEQKYNPYYSSAHNASRKIIKQ
jgi:ribonuclease HI